MVLSALTAGRFEVGDQSVWKYVAMHIVLKLWPPA